MVSLLKIGEFSVLSQISIYMLRHYDEIGLLIPEQVDEFTGYRYYSERQLPIAGKIQALKSMGLSLNLIKEILTKYSDNTELKNYLELQAIEQKEKIEHMRKQLNLLETTIANLDRASDIPLYSVALKKIPAHYVISVRGIIETPDKEAELWERLAQERKKQKIQFANPAWNIAVFHDEGFQERNLDVEIQQAVIGKCRNSDIMKYKKVDEITAATLTFKGRYALLPQANEEIIRWIGDNRYTSSRISRTLSTPLLEAASISTTSRTEPSRIPRQAGHSLQGSPLTGCSQFTARARIFAQVVLPVPRVPVNKYA